MEIRKKKISLAGLFGRYIFMFVTGTFFAALISGAVMFFLILIPSGPFLPANYAEQQLINTKETLQEADITEEEMINRIIQYKKAKTLGYRGYIFR